MKKIRLALIYGGQSGEHEVSLRSAASVMRELHPARYEVIPIGIDKQGRWLLNDVSLITKDETVLPIYQRAAEQVILPPNPDAAVTGLIHLGDEGAGVQGTMGGGAFDVVFP